MSTNLVPEYVLKVDNTISQKKSHETSRKNKNPRNLPAIRNEAHLRAVKKIIVFTFLFLSAFSAAVFIGYNATFMLFTLK
jgi:hypothetical protein